METLLLSAQQEISAKNASLEEREKVGWTFLYTLFLLWELAIFTNGFSSSFCKSASSFCLQPWHFDDRKNCKLQEILKLRDQKDKSEAETKARDDEIEAYKIQVVSFTFLLNLFFVAVLRPR